MPKKKRYGLLIVGLVLLVVSIIWSVYAHNTTYAQSTEVGTLLSEVKAQITAIEEKTATGDLDALKAQKTELSDKKLELEKPYSYGLTLLFISVMLAIKGLYNAVVGRFLLKKQISNV